MIRYVTTTDITGLQASIELEVVLELVPVYSHPSRHPV